MIRLDLRNNLIAMIGDRTFIEMPSLRQLELDQNEIVYISEKALDGMRNLKELSLSENKLVTLEPDFLAGAPGLYLLDLRDNLLKTMTFDNIKPIVTNLYNSTSHFYLSGESCLYFSPSGLLLGFLKFLYSLQRLEYVIADTNIRNLIFIFEIAKKFTS